MGKLRNIAVCFLYALQFLSDFNAAKRTKCVRDIAFVVDTNGYRENWDLVINFMQQILGDLEIGPKEARIAAFSLIPPGKVWFYLDKYPTHQEVLVAIRNRADQGVKDAQIPLNLALHQVRTEIFNGGPGDRRDVEDVIILIMSKSVDTTPARLKYIGDKLKEDKIRVIGIGMAEAEKERLADVVSEPVHEFLYYKKKIHENYLVNFKEDAKAIFYYRESIVEQACRYIEPAPEDPFDLTPPALPKPPHQCMNCKHGFCQSQCECDPGYQGPNCDQEMDACVDQPCYSAGKCMNAVTRFECHCLSFFVGKDCLMGRNDCDEYLCGRPGTCLRNITNRSCVCDNGQISEFCRSGNQCRPNPCQNGGTCREMEDDYYCECIPGYIGRNCEGANLCLQLPCQNGGACKGELRGYSCYCPHGFDGYHCERDLDECISRPCLNGAKCINGKGFYKCDCPAGTDGPNCRFFGVRPIMYIRKPKVASVYKRVDLKVHGIHENTEYMAGCYSYSKVNYKTVVFKIHNGTNSIIHCPIRKEGDKMICSVKLKFFRQEDGNEWHCEASWHRKAGTDPIVLKSDKISLDVKFDPTRISITTRFTQDRVIRGTFVTAECQTDSADPPAKIEWFWMLRDDNKVYENEETTITDFVRDGEYGGKISVSKITVTASKDTYGKYWSCKTSTTDKYKETLAASPYTQLRLLTRGDFLEKPQNYGIVKGDKNPVFKCKTTDGFLDWFVKWAGRDDFEILTNGAKLRPGSISSGYAVDEDDQRLDLRITHQEMRHAGVYRCTFLGGKTKHRYAQYTMLENNPKCKHSIEHKTYLEGETVTGECDVAYKGPIEVHMVWRSAEGFMRDVIDESIPGERARVRIRIPLKREYHQKTFSCITYFDRPHIPPGEEGWSDNIPPYHWGYQTDRVSIHWPADRATITPVQEVYTPGDTLHCDGEANPPVSFYTWEYITSNMTVIIDQGSTKKDVEVQRAWGRFGTLTIRCSLKNKMRDGPVTKSVELSIKVDNTFKCTSNPCLHGGQCEELEDGYKCRCAEGYGGLRCDQDIDDCVPMPCANGMCIDRLNTHTCICYDGFIGRLCDISENQCVPEYCQHGTCSSGIQVPPCKCDAGWRGAACDIHTSRCTPEVCQNGGLCIDLRENYQCQCPSGYMGSHCEKSTFKVVIIGHEAPIPIGTPLKLTCTVKADSSQVIGFQWTFNGHLLSTAQSYSKATASMADGGTYICEARQGQKVAMGTAVVVVTTDVMKDVGGADVDGDGGGGGDGGSGVLIYGIIALVVVVIAAGIISFMVVRKKTLAGKMSLENIARRQRGDSQTKNWLGLPE